MGYFSNWRQSRVKLTNTERQTLWKVLGSFGANQLGQSKQSYIQKGYEGNVDVYAVIKKLTDVTNSIPYVVEKNVGGVWELFEQTAMLTHRRITLEEVLRERDGTPNTLVYSAAAE